MKAKQENDTDEVKKEIEDIRIYDMDDINAMEQTHKDDLSLVS